MLSIRGLSKTYPNGVQALRDVSLEVAPGMFGLLGPNGAGKTTLMKILATLLDADAGAVTVGRIDFIRRKPEARRVLGYLPQEFGLYPTLTAEQTLDYFARLKGVADARERRTLVGALLERVNLSAECAQQVGGFSGGMRQRLGIAQALIGRQKLLVVDEPTAGLDPEERVRFHNLLAEIADDEAVVLLSTHIVSDVSNLCARMAVIRRGRIVAATDAARGIGLRRRLGLGGDGRTRAGRGVEEGSARHLAAGVRGARARARPLTGREACGGVRARPTHPRRPLPQPDGEAGEFELTSEFALTRMQRARRGSAFANFAAVVRAELLYNRRRVAPYVMAALFAGNALLWWGWGAAMSYGWAVNSDYYILRCLLGFTFMTTPFFVALLMADPVARDYRLGVDPLIFSKPVSRAEYLSGKFFGNYLVLTCCQFCFPLTMLSLQLFTRDGMVALPPRFAPYFTLFLFFTAAPSLLLAAVCFAAGTLTHSVKLVYGLVTSLYVLYMGAQVSARGLPRRWRVLPDPLLMNAYTGNPRAHSPDYFNSLVVGYDADMLLNRALVVLTAAACLAFLYARFSTTERQQRARGAMTTLDLAGETAWLGGEASGTVAARGVDEGAEARRGTRRN